MIINSSLIFYTNLRTHVRTINTGRFEMAHVCSIINSFHDAAE